MIADMLSNKILNLIVTELFIKDRKLNICYAKKNRLNSTHYFIMKIPNKRELFDKLHLIIHQILTLKTL